MNADFLMDPLAIIIIIAISVSLFFAYRKIHSKTWHKPEQPFPEVWRKILQDYVSYYRSLNDDEKQRFEYRIMEFLLNYRITPVDCRVDLTDRLLVASSAVIPLFTFQEWRYPNLDEVLIYPASFNEGFQVSGTDTTILGMVGTGFMEGKMILAKTAIKNGFLYEEDRRNTAIHEFVHLIDKADGKVDGIPQKLLKRPYLIPWFDMMAKEINAIVQRKSEINAYGATNNAEFLSVASEYFFENPVMLSTRHPELYSLMQEMYGQDLKTRSKVIKTNVLRNDPCPCHSGKKYKNCCGRI